MGGSDLGVLACVAEPAGSLPASGHGVGVHLVAPTILLLREDARLGPQACALWRCPRRTAGLRGETGRSG